MASCKLASAYFGKVANLLAVVAELSVCRTLRALPGCGLAPQPGHCGNNGVNDAVTF